MFEKITTLINEWDPLGLSPFAPDDEYSLEIKKIYEAFMSINDIDKLSKEIWNVFVNSFGLDSFEKTQDDCVELARDIVLTK